MMLKSILSLILLLFCQVCTPVMLTGHQVVNVVVNKVDANITIATMKATKNDVFVINEKEYHIKEVWTIFNLEYMSPYEVSDWYMISDCGPTTQQCGVSGQCLNTYFFCSTWQGGERGWFTSTVSGKADNFCYSLNKFGTKTHHSYALNEIATIVRTDYGGPYIPLNEPGFTVSSITKDNGYTYNPQITDVEYRKKLILPSYRYATSLNRIVNIDAVQLLDKVPTVEPDWSKATCERDGSWHSHVPYTIKKHDVMETDFTDFTSYVVIDDLFVGKKLGSNLDNAIILTPSGPQAWKNTDRMDFIDPCNQQFLTLIKLGNGHFVVFPPLTQKIDEEKICILFMGPYSRFIAWEFKNDTDFFVGSESFKGILSPDFVDKLDFRITTNSTVKFSLTEADIDVTFNNEKLTMKVTTSIPIKCVFSVSQSCTFDIELTESELTKSKNLASCGTLYTRGSYNCEGIIGGFTPPTNLSAVKPEDHFFVNSQDKVAEVFNQKEVSMTKGFNLVEIFAGSFLGKIAFAFLSAMFILAAWRVYKFLKKELDESKEKSRRRKYNELDEEKRISRKDSSK